MPLVVLRPSILAQENSAGRDNDFIAGIGVPGRSLGHRNDHGVPTYRIVHGSRLLGVIDYRATLNVVLQMSGIDDCFEPARLF